MGCAGDAYTFDPVVLGDRERDAWVHYYRREWAPFLRDSLRLVSEGFGLGPRTGASSWIPSRRRREVQWWQLHRVHQRENNVTETQLEERRTLIALYSALRAAIDEQGLAATRHIA